MFRIFFMIASLTFTALISSLSAEASNYRVQNVTTHFANFEFPVNQAADEVIGEWKMESATCMPGQGNPRFTVAMDLSVGADTFIAHGSVGIVKCVIKGTYTYTSGNIGFTVVESGRCPIGLDPAGVFTASVNGNRATVILPELAARVACGRQFKEVHLEMVKQ